MPTILLIPSLPAALILARFRDGETLVLVDAGQPWRRIVGMTQLLLPREQRREVYRVLLTH